MQRGLARTLVASVMGVGLALGFAGAAQADEDFPESTPVVDVTPSNGPSAISPITNPVNSGSRKWSVEYYIQAWERANGRRMSSGERAALDRGCIGVSVANLERGNINPPLGMSFHSFEQANAVMQALRDVLRGNPSLGTYRLRVTQHPLLSQIKNMPMNFPSGFSVADVKPVMFSKRFFDGDEEGTPRIYTPDRRTGQVDMSYYDYAAKPGYVNFDYGWYDENTNNWWHANHAAPGMEIYQSTLRYYSRPLLDFDSQVFSVTFGKN